MDASGAAPTDPELNRRIDVLCDAGRDFWRDFDADVRRAEWHPFVPADYDAVRTTLFSLRRPGLRFLEWGSGSGIITIMADLMGFEACGIELDASLVGSARGLAERAGSHARFATGSFLPTAWQWHPADGDTRTATIGTGASGYDELGHDLDDFDVVYGYPWSGEEPLMYDLMQQKGAPDAVLVIHRATGGVCVHRPAGDGEGARAPDPEPAQTV